MKRISFMKKFSILLFFNLFFCSQFFFIFANDQLLINGICAAYKNILISIEDLRNKKNFMILSHQSSLDNSQILKEQIMFAMVLEKGAKLGSFEPTPDEVDQKIQELIKTYKSKKDYDDKVQILGISTEIIKNQIKNQIIIQRFVENILYSTIFLKDEEFQKLKESSPNLNEGEMRNILMEKKKKEKVDEWYRNNQTDILYIMDTNTLQNISL